MIAGETKDATGDQQLEIIKEVKDFELPAKHQGSTSREPLGRTLTVSVNREPPAMSESAA